MEIGSDYNLDISNLKLAKNSIFDKLQDYNTEYLSSGRNALKLLLKKFSSGKVLLPEYICDSVINQFDNFDIAYYKINLDFSINFVDLEKKIDNNTKIVFLMHYFGILQPNSILKNMIDLKEKFDFTIIEDTTHSIFTKESTIGDYHICSLRKSLAIPDGGVLYSKRSLDFFDGNKYMYYNSYDKFVAMSLKTLYLHSDYLCKEHFLKLFEKSENLINEIQDIYKISKLSFWLLSQYDFDEISKIRIDNYTYIRSKLEKISINTVFKSLINFVPYSLPIFFENRNHIRSSLIKKDIYCPIHWPIEREFLFSSNLKIINDKILSIPIDQRYNLDDMDRIVDTFKSFKEVRF